MATDKANEENIQEHTEAYYEELASEEEIYLEEIEEHARAVLIAEQPTFSRSGAGIVAWEARCSVTDASGNPGMAESRVEQLEHATEELITGDSDDPPLSDEALAKMLKAG